jgi:hypothetical protein
MLPYLSRDFSELDIAVRLLEWVVNTALGDLSQGIDKGLNFFTLRIRNGKDGMRILIERMDNRHFRLGIFAPDSID